MHPPSGLMEKEAVSAGYYETGGKKFRRVQILTAAEILKGSLPGIRLGTNESLKRAKVEKDETTRETVPESHPKSSE